MKLTTDTLAGKALDWAASQAHQDGGPPVAYSTDWQFGGPIIEREGIAIKPSTLGTAWKAVSRTSTCTGWSPLIAAMRCYVASTLGDEIEVPDEIVHDAIQRLAVEAG